MGAFASSLVTVNELNYPVARGKCRGKDLYGDNMWMNNKGSVTNLRVLLVQGKTVFSDMGQI